MKKILLYLIVIIMFISLCGCENNSNENNLEKNKLNNQESDLNVNYSKEINITLDNWQEYFDIIMYEVNSINDFNELEKTYKENYLVLKDEFSFSKEKSTSLTVEISFDEEKHYYKVNDTKDKVEWLDTRISETDKNEISKCVSDFAYYGKLLPFENSFHGGSDEFGEFVRVKTNIEIIRIKGTLYLGQ